MTESASAPPLMLLLQDFITAHHVQARILAFDHPLPTVPLAAEAAGVPPSQIIKTLILYDGSTPYVAVILTGDRRLDLGHVLRQVGAQQSRFRPHPDVRRI